MNREKKGGKKERKKNASSSICRRLFSQIYWFIHPIFDLPLVVQQAEYWAFKKTLKLVRVAEIATVEQVKHTKRNVVDYE